MTEINSKVSPEIFQSIMLDEIAGRLADLTALISAQAPKGNVYTLPLVVDTNGQSVIILYAATIYNDGDADVYVFRDDNRNIDTSDTPLHKGDNLIIDLKKQSNKTLWLKTLAATASVRIFMME